MYHKKRRHCNELVFKYGLFVGSCTSFWVGCMEVVIAKALTMHEAFSWLKDKGVKYVTLKSDCSHVVDALNTFFVRTCFHSLSFQWISRNALNTFFVNVPSAYES